MALKQFKYVDRPKLASTTAIKGHAYAYMPAAANIEFIVVAPSLKKLRKAYALMNVPDKIVMSRVQKVLVVGEK